MANSAPRLCADCVESGKALCEENGNPRGVGFDQCKNQWRRVFEKSIELMNVTATSRTTAARRAKMITTFS
jgi:hypothetical protein